jgi:8-oxo-dGTP diphosphatase
MIGQAFSFSPSPIAAVLAVIVHEGQTLLVRRANPPDAGLWGFPGGKIEHGETVEAAALRELVEETSVQGEALDVITTLDVFDRTDDGDLRRHFILIAVRCRWLFGVPSAGDDALEACWFPIVNLNPENIPMSAGVDVIARRAKELPLGRNAP